MENKLNINRFKEAWAAALSYELSLRTKTTIKVTVNLREKEERSPAPAA